MSEPKEIFQRKLTALDIQSTFGSEAEYREALIIFCVDLSVCSCRPIKIQDYTLNILPIFFYAYILYVNNLFHLAFLNTTLKYLLFSYKCLNFGEER
jgi:hypothetical protein